VRAGFTVVRISGSHHVMRHPDGRTIVVPVHAGRDIAKGTLRPVRPHIPMKSRARSTAGERSDLTFIRLVCTSVLAT
jgi:predicted RNA binding protein YcfA (HicA-like mRNA interferase family)